MADIKVNPPKALRKPMQIGGTSQEFKYFEGIETILFQLKQRTGGEQSTLLSGAGAWESGKTYQPYDLVRQDGWAGYALVETDEALAPSKQGAEYFNYTGTIGTDSAITNQLVYGQRYTLDVAKYVVGYRIYTVIGNFYSIYAEVDNGGIKEVISFTSNSTGWTEVDITDQIFVEGAVFDFIVVVAEPSPTPTITTLSYNYTTPNNDGAPLTGQMLHSNQATGLLNVHKSDQGGDQSAFLATLDIGDTIEGGGVRWAIQSITDQGAYYTFGVAPAQQASPDGIQDFDFETTVPTPITYAVDAGEWSGSVTTRGLFTSTGGVGDLVENDNQYGIDAKFNNAFVSDDWFRLAYTDGIGGSGESGGGGASANSVPITIESLDPTTTNARYGIDPAVYKIDRTLYLDGNYKVIVGCEVSSSATNRAATVGIRIDNTLIDNALSCEPKDSRDLLWVHKEFTYFFDGATPFQIQIGKSYGGGGSSITVENLRVRLERE